MRARAANFTNEGGVDGRIRFLHNVMGLWLLSESRARRGSAAASPIDLAALLAAGGGRRPAPCRSSTPNDPRVPRRPATCPRASRPGSPSTGVARAARARRVRAQHPREPRARPSRGASHSARRAQRASTSTVDPHRRRRLAQNALLCQLTADRDRPARARRPGRGDRDRQRARAGARPRARRRRPRVAARPRGAELRGHAVRACPLVLRGGVVVVAAPEITRRATSREVVGDDAADRARLAPAARCSRCG